jgi:hypothetical protein
MGREAQEEVSQVDRPKTSAERRAEREAEIEREESEHSAALARISIAQRLGVRPDDLTDEQLAASGLAAHTQKPARFPSTLAVRRQILEPIASGNEKYAWPFDIGKLATISLIGTESWSDYGAVVLQMAMLDTLLAME